MRTFEDLGLKVITYSAITLGAKHEYTLNLVSLFEELSKVNTIFPTEDLETALEQYFEIIDKIAESEGK